MLNLDPFFKCSMHGQPCNAIHGQRPKVIVKPHFYPFIASRHPSSTIGECIRMARLEKGLREKDLAQAIGGNEMTIVTGRVQTECRYGIVQHQGSEFP